MRSLTLKHSNWLIGWGGRGDLYAARGLRYAADACAGCDERVDERGEHSTPRGVLARRTTSSSGETSKEEAG